VKGTVLTSRPVLVTAALLAVLLAYWSWAYAAGARKLTEAEITEARELSGDPARINILIELPFAPEQFHFLRLQEIGRMAGAGERSVMLRSVSVDAARRLARRYWVSDIVPLEPQ
jgi:hypothetical protein